MVRFDLSLPRSMMSLKTLLPLTKPIRYNNNNNNNNNNNFIYIALKSNNCPKR